MGMGVGLQPPRLRRTHPSGELPRSSKGPQSPQDAAWGTCPWPPCPRSCAGPERLPRGHLSSPRHTAAGWGGAAWAPDPAWTGMDRPRSRPGFGRQAQVRPRTLAAQWVTLPRTGLSPAQSPASFPEVPPGVHRPETSTSPSSTKRAANQALVSAGPHAHHLAWWDWHPEATHPG